MSQGQTEVVENVSGQCRKISAKRFIPSILDKQEQNIRI